MAEEKPVQQPKPEEESKKDTVRINLPPGMTDRPPVPTVKIKTGSEDGMKTGVAKTPSVPNPKVEVAAAKPTIPEMPRPTVKLRQPDAPVSVPATTAPVRAATPVVMECGGNSGMIVAAMALSILVLAYLAVLALG